MFKNIHKIYKFIAKIVSDCHPRLVPCTTDPGTLAGVTCVFVMPASVVPYKKLTPQRDVNPESWTQLSGFSCIRNTQKKNGLKL